MDDAYKNGGMSEELYARFNDEIKSATSAWVDMLYDRRASLQIQKERHEDYLNHRLTPMTPNDLNEYTAQRKARLMRKEGFDIEEFFKRIAAARYGELAVGGKDS